MNDNIVSHITRAYVEELISPKSNKPYKMLNVIFYLPNGKLYKYAGFLNSDQISLIEFSEPMPGSATL